MSHHSLKNGYQQFVARINRFPQGAPASDSFYKILSVLVTKDEASYLARLPIRPFTSNQASKCWHVSIHEARKILDGLSKKALLLDVEIDDEITKYVLPPPMAGFMEFAFMRTRGDIDQKLLSELYYQYLDVEEDFIKELFLGTETRMGRVFVQEGVLTSDNATHVLEFERASSTIESASHIGVGLCYCRHKAQHLGTNCDAPLDICMTFGNTADSLIRKEYARRVDKVEGLELLHQAYEHNLIQCGENVRENVTFICNCCGCCCEGMVAVKRYGSLHPIHTTEFLPTINDQLCTECGKCIKVCPIGAISKVDGKIIVDESICLGCGVCVRNCNKKSLGLKRRNRKIITPLNTTHRLVLASLEKNQLQNLIFDNYESRGHRGLAAILGSILRLSPVKRALASNQVKSVYLEKLIKLFDKTSKGKI